MTTYYKLTRRTGLMNAIHQSLTTRPDVLTQYRRGEIARPEVGKLFVFDNLPDAVLFWGKLAIPAFKMMWECTVGEVTYPKWIATWPDDYKAFWEGNLKDVRHPPPGTACTDWVRLTAPVNFDVIRSTKVPGSMMLSVIQRSA